MTRFPAVADRFYPGDKETLRQTVDALFNRYSPEKRKNVLGVVSPHAGYVFSGGICAETLNCVDIPETVVILGPNHHGRGARISLSKTRWRMPTGDVDVNEEFCNILQRLDTTVEVDESAHSLEHSLEVQVPFLQALQPKLSIVPVVLSHLSFNECEHLGEILATAVSQYGKKVLLLASSDMTHFEPRKTAEVKDAKALEQLAALDPEGLYSTVHSNHITMCGIIPTTVVLHAALQLGANKAEIIRYNDSGAISGDTDSVVGYAGALMYKD